MNLKKSQRGQIVVEYVLLLTISVSIAVTLISTLVKRNSDDPSESGVLIIKWQQMLNAIGDDDPNKTR